MKLEFPTYQEALNAMNALIASNPAGVTMVQRAAGFEEIVFSSARRLQFRVVRPPKPEHLYHDSRGCPHECAEDHTHPRDL